MARREVLGVGTAGMVFDTKPQLLPINVWSGGRNIRFDRNKAYPVGGVTEFKSGITNNFSVGLATATLARYTIYSADGKIYVNDGTTETDITEAATVYNEDADTPFEYFMYNGFLMAHNSANITQTWDPSVISNELQDLVNWDPLHIAKVMRSFGPFLIALDINKDGNLFPHMIKWSHPAEPGSLPNSWDHTDPTRETGEFSFSDTDRGVLVNGLEMGDRFYVYKRGAVWAMSYVGGQDVFGRNRISGEIGLEYKKSLVNIPYKEGGVQFFAGQDSFYLMDGIRTVPMFMEVFQREFQQLVDTEFQQRSFSVLNHVKNEMWFCFPERGSEFCTLAFCWNYHNNTYSMRELSGTTSIVSGFGITDESESVIQPLPFSDGTFFSDGSGFADEALVFSIPSMVEAGVADGKVFNLERGSLDYSGQNQHCYVERVALAAIGNKPGEEIDYRKRKLLLSIVPKLYEGSMIFQAGVQEYEQQPITWFDELVINPTTYILRLPIPVSGRFLSFRFKCIPGSSFELAGFDYEINLLGEF